MDTKVSLVFGGASGIGLEVARHFKELGHKVIVLDKEKLSNDEGTESIKLDVANEINTKNIVDKIVEKGLFIDNVFFSAGKHILGSIEEVDTKDAFGLFNCNFWGAVFVLKAVLPHMKSRKSGKIVLLGSDQSLIGKKKQAIYGASKAAMSHLVKTTCLDYAKYNININCICAGTIDTLFMHNGILEASKVINVSPEQVLQNLINAQPVRRLGTAAEVASLVVYLCSDGASFINGTNISIDGGYTAQ